MSALEKSIDTAGDVDAALGGWESIRSLLSSDGTFSPKRTFDSTHSIRRRRFFRNRTGHQGLATMSGVDVDLASSKNGRYQAGIDAIHHPLHDSFSREDRCSIRNKKRKQNGDRAIRDMAQSSGDPGIQISAKCGDGKWSVPATISAQGRAMVFFECWVRDGLV